MSTRIICAAAAVAAFCTPAIADEAWEIASEGTVFYEKDIGDMAVFQLAAGGSVVRFYMPELASMLDDRGTHEGYWIDDDDGPCDANLAGPDGHNSDNWGKIILTFDQSTFPSNWTALVGQCVDQPDYGLRAVSTAQQ